jgi:hypothetical protein
MKRVIIAWLLFCTVAAAATSRAAYQARVKEAAQLAQAAAAAGKDAPVEETYERLIQLLPAKEEVADGAQTIHVNNEWLHAQLAELAADDEVRARQWQELAAYLSALNRRVNDTSLPVPATFRLDRAQLESILARPEYKTDEKQESAIQQWLKRMGRRLLEWLNKLFSAGEVKSSDKPSQVLIGVARFIIIALLAAALGYALYRLFGWWGRRPKKEKESVREILGVEITEETTTEDLLAAARALAQQDDYRGAIRRAYIALLYELEQRGKLRLHRAKTNRDYLNALRTEAAVYPAFAALTNHFERVWYGQTPATANDFEGFLTGYQKVASG